MNIEDFLQGVDSSELDQQIQQKQRYVSHQKDKLYREIDQKISNLILVKKRKLDYSAYTEASEILKVFLTSVKNLVDVYFNLLDDQQKILLFNFTDIKQLVFKFRFCLFRSVHNMNRSLIKQNQFGSNSESPTIPSSQVSQDKKKKKKKKKGKNSKMMIDQTGCMYTWILQNFENPYPSQQQKQKLSRDSKISVSKVNYWFINMRERTLKKLMSGQNSGLVKKKKNGKQSSQKYGDISGEDSFMGAQSISDSQNS